MHKFQDVQNKLRGDLQAAFPGPGLPTATQILDANIPYLDGTIEESLRLASIISFARQATVDTEVLGRKIPKGTTINMNPILHHRPVPVPEEIRSASSQEAYKRRGGPGLDGPAGDDLEDFKPERWLTEKDGEVVFDANTIPRLAFGGGPRGCFGTSCI